MNLPPGRDLFTWFGILFGACGVLELSIMYRRALVTMFLRPPPFVYPLFLRFGDEENAVYLSTFFSLHTVVSVLLFIMLVSLIG